MKRRVQICCSSTFFCVSNVRPLMRGQLRNNVDDPGNLQAQLSHLLTKWVLHCKSWSKKFRNIYSENTCFHISTHFEISSTFPEIFPYISDFASKTLDTCIAARKAICRLTNKGRMVFQQKCLMQLRGDAIINAYCTCRSVVLIQSLIQSFPRSFRGSVEPEVELHSSHSFYKPAGARYEPIKGSPGGNKLISTWLASL